MVDTTKIIIGIIGILLVGGAGVYLLTPEQLSKASTCTTTNVTGIFESFSATNVTAYWTIDGIKKQTVCTKGKWIPTNDWIKINGLSAKDVTINPIEESNITEDNIEIITIGKTITVDKAKQVSIEGKIYNISYTPIIKCICDKETGCQIKECLG